MQLTTCSMASSLRAMIARQQLGRRLEDRRRVVALHADRAAQREQSASVSDCRRALPAPPRRAAARILGRAETAMRAGARSPSASGPKAIALQLEHRVADRLAHPPHLAVAALVDRQLELLGAASPRRARPARARRRGEAVLELRRRARSARSAASLGRAAADARAVGLAGPRSGDGSSRFASSPSLVSRISPLLSASRRPTGYSRSAARSPRAATHGRAAVRVARGRDDADGLVHGVDDARLGAAERAPVELDALAGLRRRGPGR